MATHPKRALPGSEPGRKAVLPLSRLGEVYALAASGCTVEEIAEGLGVNRSTLFRRRRKAPEFQHALKRGRAEFHHSVKQGGVAYARLLAARRASRAVEEEHERRIELQLARMDLKTLLNDPQHSSVSRSPPPERTPPSAAVPSRTRLTQRPALRVSDARLSGTATEHHLSGDPVPIADPLAEELGDGDDALPLDEPF